MNYTFDGTFYDKATGIHFAMETLMANPNHNRPLITKSVLHVRNYKTGLGLRDFTWSLLYTIAQKNQHLAMNIMQTMIENGGTWKDPRDFAIFCQKYGYAALHKQLMALYVIQLLADLDTYRHLGLDENPRFKLSFAAKYAPREHSWLHHYVMSIWNTMHPECVKIMETATATASYETFYKATHKCAMIYRQSVSMLNRALETTEIAMCAQTWDTLRPCKIPLQTQLKYRQCFKKRIENYSESQFTKAMPLWLIVKYVHTCPNEANYWNDVWQMRTQNIKPSKYVVPCINLDTTLFDRDNINLFYKATAEALVLAKQSLFGNFVLTFAHLTFMVNTEACTLLSAIENIHGVIFHEIEACVGCGFAAVQEALTHANITTEEMENVSVVLITHKQLKNSLPDFNFKSEIKYIY